VSRPDASTQPEKILIFQIGSLGDTVISMPCYREIARRHPTAQRYLLTNFPIGSKMVPAETVLAGTGLIEGSVEYPMPLRGATAIRALYRRVVALGARTMYYLTPETRTLRMVRHYTFFRLCGITDIRGVPWSADLRFPRKIADRDLWESEASRLLRCIGAHDQAGPPPLADRALDLSAPEHRAAETALSGSLGAREFIAISVGGKVPVNNWGDENWSRLLQRLSHEFPELGAVFVGSADERNRNELLAKAWRGPSGNLCGLLTPRETAAVLSRARVFIGHDTGTLHLAAAAGARVIGIFSARNKPGKWYSDRPDDSFLYRKVDCFGCECVKVDECPHDRKCIQSIEPDEVFTVARTKVAEPARSLRLAVESL
jgi:ADP-heptose:LPS heptosyltransferase